MDEFLHPPKKPFRPQSQPPKLDQIKPADKKETEPADASLPISDRLKKTEPEISLKDNFIPIPDKVDNSDNQAEETDPQPADEPEEKPLHDYHITPAHHRRSIKKIIIIAIAVLVLLGGGAAAYWFYFRDKQPTVANNNQPSSSVKTTPTPTPTPISPLTGLNLSSASLANRPVTGLMIENSFEARPQSGLIDAGIVFEAIAEGGITRFLALYQESQPQYIGPIRSIRPYFVDFALGFDAAVGHVGGSPDALSDIRNLGMRDLDQFANASAYWRTSDRYAPHNVYTSFERLDALNTAKGFTSSKFTSFARKKDVPQSPVAGMVDFAISSAAFNPRFQYDPASNSYKRSQNGENHIDEKTSAQISPKVVIALVMNKTLASDGSHTVYQDTGSGKMFVFQDGIVSTGSWSKPERRSQFNFTDDNELPMKLNAGQVWISIVDSESDINYRS